MKQTMTVLIVIVSICLLSMGSWEKKPDAEPAVKEIGNLYAKQAASLDSFLAVYPSYFYDSSYETRERKYQELAYYFKRAANFIIYFDQSIYYNKLIGPFRLKRSERKGFFGIVPDDWIFTGPIGNEADSIIAVTSKEDMVQQAEFIREIVEKYRKALKECRYKERFNAIDASGLFDALRIEIFRISTIDLANADFIIESAAMPSLNGSMDSWLLFTDQLVKRLPSSKKALGQRWANLSAFTKKYLAENKDFKKFDRMFFTREVLIPLSAKLNEIQLALNVPLSKKFSALSADARHIYDANIFNADYFAPNKDAFYTAARVKLGELLFFDPILSDNNKRACASCHKPELAFTDGRKTSVGFDFDDLSRNSPTVINAGFQKATFWDQRASSLEDQLDSVINNTSELHSSFENVIDRINSSPEYVELFQQAFPATKKNGISRQDVKNAIGCYERTVTGLNSRFDQYMRGDLTKMTAEEVNGFNIFLGKAKCGTCHFTPLFNGAVPPFFEITDHHSLGVPVRDTMAVYRIDPDDGMFKSTRDPLTRFSFKVPTVRNIELTAPYMHNGVYKTLEQVVNFYDHAAGEKFRKEMKPGLQGIPFFTIIPIELKLTDTEKKELIAFMRALTDTSAARTPKRLPELKGKHAGINKRIIGGEY